MIYRTWLAFGLGMVGLLSQGASAATISVGVSGTCAFGCENVGLTEGGSFNGNIGVDSGAFTPNSFSSGVTSYSFAFGSFAMSEADEALSNNLVQWGDTANDVEAVYIFAFASEDPGSPSSYLSLSALAGPGGSAYAANDAFWFVNPDGSFGGSEGNGATLSVDPIGAVPIPVPAAGWLLASALVGLAAFRKRWA